MTEESSVLLLCKALDKLEDNNINYCYNLFLSLSVIFCLKSELNLMFDTWNCILLFNAFFIIFQNIENTLSVGPNSAPNILMQRKNWMHLSKHCVSLSTKMLVQIVSAINIAQHMWWIKYISIHSACILYSISIYLYTGSHLLSHQTLEWIP